ncbi:hypothetical protein LAZ67_10002459 [Cordylochernes scorpioides]|uniref:Uncharacterized protein n=1 Tax=Cordylochernes scorpioides TaxID=51811 RepID=A0ABY6KWP8_9ARAC|nr:hypothetical protein LAZ67_10002459 [Cordylochernes scorpioides]
MCWDIKKDVTTAYVVEDAGHDETTVQREATIALVTSTFIDLLARVLVYDSQLERKKVSFRKWMITREYKEGSITTLIC